MSQTKLPSPQERLELILLGIARQQPIQVLCQQAGVSRELFYRWMKRIKQMALKELEAKAPGPKMVTNNPSQQIQKLNERVKLLESQTKQLRKERDHQRLLFQVAQRIIHRRAWGPIPEVTSKKNAMRPKTPRTSIAKSGIVNPPKEFASNYSVNSGESTGPRIGDGSKEN
jgi:lysyl-tRNA synthetase class I